MSDGYLPLSISGAAIPLRSRGTAGPELEPRLPAGDPSETEPIPLDRSPDPDAAIRDGPADGAPGDLDGNPRPELRTDPRRDPDIDRRSRPEAIARANRDFRVVFLREMLRPLTRKLSSSALSGTASSGSGIYSYFWEDALIQQLAEAWPLPAAFGLPEAAAASDASAPDAGAPDSARERSPLPASLRPAPVAALDAGEAPTPGSPGLESTGRGSHAGSTDSRSEGSAGPARAPSSAHVPELPENLIARAGRLFAVPANLIRAVMLTESGGRADAVSAKGARGLMQIMPEAAGEMGISDAFDPWQNVYAGTKYLSRQLARFGSLPEALAAYNAGPGTVVRHGGVPRYAETRRFIERVLAWKSHLDEVHPSGS